MMTVYVMVMTICSGFEGCVEERRTEPTYATKEMCMAMARDIAPRKGVKYKCRSERLLIPVKAPTANSLDSVVSTGAKGLP